MLMIRFQRIGRVNDAAFRIVVLEKERAAKSSRLTDRIGSYNPHSKATSIDAEKAKMWLSRGGQPTETVHNLFVSKGIIAGKKVNALPSRRVQKKDLPAQAGGEEVAAGAAKAVEAEAAAEETAAPVAEETPAAPAA